MKKDNRIRKLYAMNGFSIQYRMDHATLDVLADAALTVRGKVNILPSQAVIIRRAIRVYVQMLKDGRMNLNREPFALLEAAKGL